MVGQRVDLEGEAMASWGEVRAARTGWWAVIVLATLALARSAVAFEFFDGKIQIHGYYENQIRTIAADFDANDGFDVSQWYNILSIETDLNVAPNGFGPFDLVSGFIRLEARFDCIWYHCGAIQGINAWGNDAKKFPTRNTGAHKSGWTGSLFTGDTRRIHSIAIDELGFADKDQPVGGNNEPAFLWHVPGVDTLFGVQDPLQTPALEDDPAFYVFGRFVKPGDEYRFALRKAKGQPDGNSLQVLGPFLPKNKILPLGSLADIANPFNPLDENPVLVPAAALDPAVSAFGSTALPYRPAPFLQAGRRASNGDGAEARGMFIPNEQIAKMMRKHEFDDFDQNFRQNELAWNKGASQSDERELKEAYVDIEMFDSRLWLRVGKQNIVWGKTELFRTTDQFNPQDLALATLASLEESRIALWAARGVYSFYSVGPLEDLRLELAVNFDQMEPTDLGRCGEPYTPNPVCDKTAALFAHGIAGSTLAGEVRPPDPWDDTEGLEYGARLEFRWDRYSFALSDFYGYDDFPYVDPVFYYTRNVDPRTGRARRGQSQDGCDPDGLFGGDTSGCLGPGEDALHHHHANQQRFALICGASIGFSPLDRAVCAQSVFNSNAFVAGQRLTSILGTVFSGSNTGRSTVIGAFFPELAPPTVPVGQGFPLVPLNADANDGPGSGPFSFASISAVLTDQQEALLGCGPFWGTSCDISDDTQFGGVDLLNAELSVLIQSWPGFPGTVGNWRVNAGPTGPIQPGTIRDCAVNPIGCSRPTGLQPFHGGAVARRFEQGQSFTLPGARSPFAEAGDLRMGPIAWDPNVDGCVRAADPGCAGAHDLRHPYSNDFFMSEMAAFSWNYMLLLIAFSQNDPVSAGPAGKPEVPCTGGQDTNTCRTVDEFISNPLYYLREDGCSYAHPELCSNIQAIYSIAHTTRRSVRAGGTGDFGRTDFDWHQGGDGVLRYEKRNVLGFSMDFAEDYTKSNWGIESTWIKGIPFEDNDEFDRLRRADTFNLTVSVDRPTFINFLNQGRTFFFNSQWFFQWINGFHESFTTPGPWNVLATFHVDTGYFSDRLLPGITFVWDFQSKSGAILPELQYRFTENLSVTLTAGVFNGRYQPNKAPIKAISDFPYRAGSRQASDWTEQGLSPVRDNDEIGLRVRYTF
jgi:hypothetical protein